MRNNNFAFGLNELQLQAVVDVSKSKNGLVACSWQGLQNCQEIQFFDNVNGCLFSLTCSSSLNCTDIIKGKRFKTIALFRNLNNLLDINIVCRQLDILNSFLWNFIAKNK